MADHEVGRLAYLRSERIEVFLDAGYGACWMKDSRIAAIVRDAILHFDGDRYDIFAWCVMPNHAHVVLRPASGHALARILHSWKSFSSKAANRVMGRSGEFWMDEYYDHLIRDEADFAHAIAYVLGNPVKAGLRGWPWVGRRVGRA